MNTIEGLLSALGFMGIVAIYVLFFRAEKEAIHKSAEAKGWKPVKIEASLALGWFHTFGAREYKVTYLNAGGFKKVAYCKANHFRVWWPNNP